MPQKQKSEKELVASAGAATTPASRRKSTAPRSKTAAPRSKHSATQAETPATSSVGLPASPAAAVAAIGEPTRDEIASLAYGYWEARGYQGGSQDEDWLRAEQELRVRVSAATA
jgi:hypothetical protein